MGDQFCGLISDIQLRLQAKDGSGALEGQDQDAQYKRLQAAAAEDAAAAHLAAVATAPEDLSTSAALADLPGWDDTSAVVVLQTTVHWARADSRGGQRARQRSPQAHMQGSSSKQWGQRKA